ncbi:hypothetical protein ACRQ5Q_10180 [Bradyrhizobium sp. PMVTL-01]|uniref:hypothetical protein n=1 Tax=Bradyrhizobium sp. PMVTL-01 TaxID=3434999 RepID=UPI003F70AE8E
MQQGFLRRLAFAGVQVLTLTEPLIGRMFEKEQARIPDVYNGDSSYDDAAFLAYPS